MRNHFLATLTTVILFGTAPTISRGADELNSDENQFKTLQYQPHPLPQFNLASDTLPSPIYDERPDWVTMYWKAWEIAYNNFHEPAPESGFVSQFMDAAFNENVFLWDTCFITMFGNYGHPIVPGISSLDNFYAKQHASGEICREINRTTGEDFEPWVNRERRDLFSRWGWNSFQPGNPKRHAETVIYRNRSTPSIAPDLTLDALNHPILAWAEAESYRITGDRERLVEVFPPLINHYRAMREYLRQGNGLYITDWASMDDSPRNPQLRYGGTGVDISSEMVLAARTLGTIAEILGKTDQAQAFAAEADETSMLINQQMWDSEKHFYYDLTVNGERISIKTIAGFWPLIAGVADANQASLLAQELENPKTFNRLHRVPTVAADEPTYQPTGYWRGGIWAPTTTMVIRGLERYNYNELARDIALNHLTNVGLIFLETGTFWENYAADSLRPGKTHRKDFVGWTGLAPIMYFLEYAIGLKPDAQHNSLQWTLYSTQRHGCERFRFNNHIVTLIAEPSDTTPNAFNISVESDGDFNLILRRNGKSLKFKIRGREKASIVF